MATIDLTVLEIAAKVLLQEYQEQLDRLFEAEEEAAQ